MVTSLPTCMLRPGIVAVKNYAHGCGSLNSEATLTYQNLDHSTS